MSVPSVKDEICSAARKLALAPASFRELEDAEGERVYRRVLRHFVAEGEPRWWWEHFTASTSRSFPDDNGWRHISEMVPSRDEHVWFIAEDDTLPFYPVYETTPAVIPAVIAECYGFEYYIVQKQLEWLLCENHHGRIIGVGKAVEERLRVYGV